MFEYFFRLGYCSVNMESHLIQGNHFKTLFRMMFLSVIKNNYISDSYLSLFFPKESQTLSGQDNREREEGEKLKLLDKCLLKRDL